MNKCEKCGFLHYRTDPCRVAKKSTAARKDVHLAPSVRSASGHEQDGRQGEKGGVVRHHLGHEAQKVGAIPTPAGTQALPVDTPKRGRPSTGFDKRAYNKQYMADRRAGKR